MPVPELIRIGFVRRPVGLGGEVLLETLTDSAERFRPGLSVHAGGAWRTVERASAEAQGVRVKLSGIDSVAAADGLRGGYLEVGPESAPPLPAGSFYHWQIVGLAAVNPDGRRLGEVVDVLEYPANDVYVVRAGGRERLVPAVTAVVKDVDLAAGRMVLDLPEEVESEV
ncbi:MAG TPA: ribosome maturation factor RimM [Candidatus Dormibacteraeota bacterium]|jgi:16S rRNA processing protein RimM|nr:ribosome maturation factor RimM [Candidatus Dormibacteraeota bacterium]